MKKLEFIELYISKDAEKQKLMDIFCVNSVGISLENRVQQYHFSLPLAEDMYKKPRHEWDEKLENFLEDAYLTNLPILIKAKQHFENIWEKKGDYYLGILNSFFEKKIPTYRVLIAYYLDVISNWHEPNIVVNYKTFQKENPLYHIYDVLFEMTLSQIFINTRKIKTKKDLPDIELWGISELSACAILNTKYPEFKNSTLTGYENLDKHAKTFIDIAAKTSNFNDFISQISTLNFSLK